MAIFSVSALNPLNQAGYLLQGVQEVHAGELRVCRYPAVVVAVLHSAFSRHEELVLRKVEKVFGGGLRLDHEIKSVERSNIEILSPCAGFLVDFRELGGNAFRVTSFYPFECYRVEDIASLSFCTRLWYKSQSLWKRAINSLFPSTVLITSSNRLRRMTYCE